MNKGFEGVGESTSCCSPGKTDEAVAKGGSAAEARPPRRGGSAQGGGEAHVPGVCSCLRGGRHRPWALAPSLNPLLSLRLIRDIGGQTKTPPRPLGGFWSLRVPGSPTRVGKLSERKGLAQAADLVLPRHAVGAGWVVADLRGPSLLRTGAGNTSLRWGFNGISDTGGTPFGLLGCRDRFLFEDCCLWRLNPFRCHCSPKPLLAVRLIRDIGSEM